MIYISEHQSEVIELLRKGAMRYRIAQLLGKQQSVVQGTVRRLIDLGLVRRDDDDKPVVVKGVRYEVRKVKSAARTIPVERKRPPVLDVQSVPITPQQAAYIQQHVETKPRRQMARELGVDKVTLNMMIMQLKLGRSG